MTNQLTGEKMKITKEEIICYRCNKKDHNYYRLKDTSPQSSDLLVLNEVVLCEDCGHKLENWIQNKRIGVKFTRDIKKAYKFNDLFKQ